MMPEVKCAVANCEYWSQGNNCHADVIMIEVDKHANMSFNEEFAGEGYDTEHQDTAGKAANTCCHTFKLKKSK
jgi:hypothetical protein